MSKLLYPLNARDFSKEIRPKLLSYKDGRARPANISDYKFFDAILYVLRTELSWMDVPEDYGSWHTIYRRFKRVQHNNTIIAPFCYTGTCDSILFKLMARAFLAA